MGRVMKTKVWSIAAILTALVPWARPQSSNGLQASMAAVTQTAIISGTVLSDATGAPLGGAIVTAYRKKPQTPLYLSQGRADAKGAFSLASLPAGTYSLCVQAPSGAYLDPCSWSDTPTSVTIADGQTSSGNTIRIQAAATLHVRVDDPGQSLKQQSNGAGRAHVLVLLIKSDGMAIPMPLTTSDATGLDHQLAVPFDTKLKILMYSKEAKMNDPDQKPVAAQGSPCDVTIPSNGPQSIEVKFTVTGRNP